MIPTAKALPMGIAAMILVGCATAAPDVSDDKLSSIPDAVVQRALETMERGRTIHWQDRFSGEAGTVTPTRTFRVAGGQYCRDYQVTYDTTEGIPLSWTETACRTDEAGWLRTSARGT
jgi:surface antigen